MESYELAWAEALAQEHARRSELLATLHRELSTFARECAASLTALDALVDMDGIAGLLDVAETGSPNAVLVRDIAGRLPGLAWTDALRNEQLSGFYTSLGEGTDLSAALVHQAGQLLRAEPARADAMLLNAIIDAAGERSVIQHVAGPAATSALNALKPISDWAPALARLGEGDGVRGKLVVAAREDLTVVLESTATAPAGAMGAESIAQPDSLRDTVEHIETAARAIVEGPLEQAIAEARLHLEASLDELRAVQRQARGAPNSWHDAKEIEGPAVVADVRETLAKVEKVRDALAVILPHLQVTARALATIEKHRSVDGRIDARAAAGITAARMSLLLAVAAAFEASLPMSRHPVVAAQLPIRKRWLVAATAVLVAAGVSIALTLTRDHARKTPAANTILNVIPGTGVPAAPTLSPIRASSDPGQKTTFYSVAGKATGQGKLRYAWHLTPPKDNPSCNKFGSVLGSPDRAVWHHSPADGCTHNGSQHLGTITVAVKTRYWECTESILGSLAARGEPAKACKRV